MPEINTNGLPNWAGQLLRNNSVTAALCSPGGASYALDLTSDAMPFPISTRLERATLHRTFGGALCLTGKFEDLGGAYTERRWLEYGNGWQEETKSGLPFPEIQIDAGMPSNSMYFLGSDGVYKSGIANLGIDPAAGPDWTNISVAVKPEASDDMKKPLYLRLREQGASSARAQQQAQQAQLAQQQFGNRLADYGEGWLQNAQDRQNFQGSLGDFQQGGILPRQKRQPPKPEPPEPRSKNGRMIVLRPPDEED